jgi:dTMP kinase
VPETDNETTVPTPIVRLDLTKGEEPGAPATPDVAETTVLPKAGAGARSAAAAGAVSGAADETAVIPAVRETGSAADETAVLPPVRDGGPAVRDGEPTVRDGEPTVRGGGPADRVPPGYFRDEPEGDRTRELPQYYSDNPEGTGNPEGAGAERRPKRRSDWAEETPLDDLPSLADELLGGPDEDEAKGRKGPGRR